MSFNKSKGINVNVEFLMDEELVSCDSAVNDWALSYLWEGNLEAVIVPKLVSYPF